MLNEAVAGLAIKPNGTYLDATYGRGGHSAEIVKRLSTEGKLIVMDRDPLAIKEARQRYATGDSIDSRVTIHHSPFSKIGSYVVEHQLDGILIDLGVSSPQLDNPERGFSFMQDGPLDMRMDQTAGESAAEWIAVVDTEEMARVIWKYGDERQSRRIARAIDRFRQESPITTTAELADIVKRAVPGKPNRKRHPATKTFQAIRIYINSELEEIETVLENSIAALAPKGRLAVISFHSLEDRMVKQFIRRSEKGEDDMPLDLPIQSMVKDGVLRRVGKAIFPSEDEIYNNPRSRSAVLRIAERTDELV
jgi:16S rRNA (cytosine1402-N4)-methyltransferase